MASSVRRLVVSPTTTVPGSATDWRRAVTLTTSPRTRPFSLPPGPTAVSPVFTPTRSWRPSMPTSSPRAGTSSISSRPARTARSASSGSALLAPPEGGDGVAGVLVDLAPEAFDHVAAAVEVGGEEPTHSLRVQLLGEGGEADEVAEQRGDETALRRRRSLRDTRRCRGGARIEGGAAVRAEAVSGVTTPAARRAGLSQPVAAAGAEPVTGVVVEAAPRATDSHPEAAG